MSDTLHRVRMRIAERDYRFSSNAYDKLDELGIDGTDVLSGIGRARVVEDYPTYGKGPCVLVLQETQSGPIHALWGFVKQTDRPAVLVTVYRPDSKRWSEDYMERR